MSERTRKIRVMYIISSFQLGGAEIYSLDLGRALKENANIAYFSVSKKGGDDLARSLLMQAGDISKNIYFGSSLPWKFGGAPISAFRLFWAIRKFRPDVIHLNTEVPEFSFSLLTILYPKYMEVGVVRTIHNTKLWGKWEKLGCWCERKLRGCSLIYVSEAVKTEFLDWRVSCHIDEEFNGAVVYNPISVPEVRRDVLSGSPRSTIKLIYAGRFEHQKGADLLEDIIKAVTIPGGLRVELDIYGDGSDREKLERLVSHAPDGWGVRVFPPTPEILKKLPNYDAMIFPSRFEGYGRMAAEAVLMGVPVVAFNLKVLREIFSDNYSFLANVGDREEMVVCFAEKLSMMLRDFPLAVREIAKAKEGLRRKVDPQSVAERTLKIYKAAVK